MRALHDVLSRRASQDALTGLPNRAAFTELLSGALARRRSSRTDVAVLFIDLDGFKAVNDTLGHSSGDELLVRTGERIRSAVRENDVVSRLGGDEFVVLCPDIDSIDTAVSVARRIAAQLGSPYHLGVQDTTISASIGIAMAAPGVTNADETVRRADIAMYEAKSGRRGQFLVFDEEMRLRVDGSGDAKMWSWMRQPKSGRIGRSPSDVARISLIASWISRSCSTSAMPPVASRRSGKAIPRPTNSSLIAGSSSDQHVR